MAGSRSARTPRPLNQLLRALPEADYRRLRPHLTTIAAPALHVFHRRGEALRYVLFPNSGLVSITASLADGTQIETGTVGKEGLVGLEAFFGPTPVALGDSMMQVSQGNADTVEQLSMAAFRAEMTRQGELFDLVGQYAAFAVAQIMQSTACNTTHPILQRCCRWLLATHDRVRGDSFDITHQTLAKMLGVRRQSVTVTAGALQRAGLLTYQHGRVTILDRRGLEAASCECYSRAREFAIVKS